ncbi:MAG TPA: hypothetical protein VJ692_09665 [Nitrospiraceae bacterium]|nr:hypothetical protein [Nitrospiraceae bacterium]
MPLSWQLLSVIGEEGADDGNETEKADERHGAGRGGKKDDSQVKENDEQKDIWTKVWGQEYQSDVQKNEENGFESRGVGNTRENLRQFEEVIKVHEVLCACEISGEVGTPSQAGAP